MYLKSIEVQGFKSFANRLVFEFNKGITGIVGPNGSGKSNVADAVRWVLGEQSAKQLRGAKMEDVIFSGTASRKPLGFASVAITLDNSDKSLPVSYETVTVSRRVYRSGESEYKINGHSCRLRDIQELFFDTGIGKEGYSIIGQGQIDKILSGKPEDRRELFDEAVGIVKYKKRKNAALKDLEEEEQNISRAEDIIHELSMQLNPLKNQSEKAKKYLELRDKLKVYEANMYLVSFDKLKKDGADVEEKLSILENQLSDTKNQYESIKTAYNEIENLMEEYDEKIRLLNETGSAQAVELQRLEGSMQLLSSKKESLRDSLAQGNKQIEDIKEKIRQKTSEISKCKEDLVSLKAEYEGSQDKENASGNELEEIRSRITSCREEMDRLSARTIEILNSISNEKSSLERYNAMQEQSDIRKAQLTSQLLSLKSEAENEGSLVEAFEKEQAQILIDLENNEAREKELTGETEKASFKLNQARQLLLEKQKSYHEESAKYKTLKNITERYDGYGNSIRRVMERKGEVPGLIGVVADIITTGKRYEIAIETALGGSISNIVTDDENTARRMIDYLKKNRYGRATFLPLTSISARDGEINEKVRKEKGFIGIADELVNTEDKYRNIASFLLGRIYIVDNIDNALAIARKYHYKLRIVTLDGESLNPGGSLSGGAYKNTGNLLSRHREMDELKNSVLVLQKEIEKCNSDIREYEETRNRGRNALEKLHGEREALNIHNNTVSLRMKQVADSQQAHDNTIAQVTRDLEQLSSNKENMGLLSRDISGKIEKYEAEKADVQEKSAAISASLEELTAEEGKLAASNTQLRLYYSSLRQKLEFTSETLSRNEKEKESLQTELDEIISRQGQTGEEDLRLDERKKELEEEIVCSKEKIGQNTTALERATTERERHSSEHKSFFEKREHISDTISSLDREQVRLTAQKEKIDERRTELGNHMWEEYKLTYVGAGEFYSQELSGQSTSHIKKLISDTRGDIKSLGDVNVNAIEQYKNVSERYQVMTAQRDDLVNAREKLNGIIDSLNTSMKKQFAEKFTLINEEFGKIFSRLFGGGSGTLTLSEPDNLLETGVIITAQPPGKKLQNMMQLSGGEKALTAIALLFAIQSLKPSPFCLLDEIEAALDDSNVSRYAEYLHNLTRDTQFIVITHRRGTMKAADILYGITMQEKGVSTMVSVSLIENQLSK